MGKFVYANPELIGESGGPANYLTGIARIPVKSFIVATSLGILPGSLFLTYAGQHLSTINRIEDFLSLPFYLALTGLAISALLPILLSLRKKPAEGPRC